MPSRQRLAIIGVGMIGGSLGRAARQRRLFRQVVGIGRRATALSLAKDMGAIDWGTTDLVDGVAEADLTVVCAPVEAIPDLVCQVADACPSQSLITDAGSTKAQLVKEIQRRRSEQSTEPHFVGSHPLAGDHRTGVTHSRPDLLDGRTVVVTPSDSNSTAAVETVVQFWQDLGAAVLKMSPDAHDEAVAATSHLPHLVASALAAATPAAAGPLAASGWRDTTRVAAADPALWRQIFTTNRAAIEMALEHFDASLAALREALATDDQDKLLKLLEEAKRIRDALGN